MLRQRILTAFIGLPIFLAAIWFGNPWFTIVIAIVAILASIEFYSATLKQIKHPIIYFGIIVIFLLTLSPYYAEFISRTIILTFVIVISLIWLLFIREKDKAFLNWAYTLAGILYIGWMLSYWSDLRHFENGKELVLWSILIVMSNDTTAFFAGRAFGKHLMAPSISPKKTWEGAASGLIISILVSVFLGILLPLPLTYWQLILFGLGISILAQLGDLVESLLKRNTGVKDSSRLIPGHGGILDRLDSFIFIGAVLYFCAALFS
jgi:phosphatidate cytidylyltransferase